MKLELVSGLTTVTITDEGLGDSATGVGNVGVITYIGAVGNFNVNVTTGTSKPVIGTVTAPQLDINSLDVTSGSGGTIIIRLTDTDFGPSTGGWALAVGGTTQGTVDYADAWVDAGNGEFIKTTSIGSMGPFGGPAFSGTDSSAVGALASPYSVTLELSITHGDGGKSTSLDFSVASTPDAGSSLVLFGAALAGLGVFARSRKQ
jgi:hypothetical protein